MYTLGLFGFLINPFMAIIWIVIVASSYTTIALWLYRKRVGTWPLKKITLKGFLIESLWSALYLSIFLFVVCLLGIILYYLFGYKDTSNWMGRYDGFKYNNVIYISILIYTFTIVPLYEELYYRGFLYNALKSRIHWIIAGICHALFFSLMHRYNFWGFITIFFAGLMLVGIYEHRKRLLTSVLAHAQMNFLASLMVFIFFVMNYHVPAQTWEEANTKPEWLYDEPPAYVKRMENGEEQRIYAINTWGSQGVRLWKREANVFNSVLTWFPEDEQACANAKLGMVNVYLFHLNDYRRAIIEVDDLLKNYSEDRETCASAWLYKAYSYYELNDYEKSRESIEVILSDYNDCEYEKGAAEYFLESLPPEYSQPSE